MTDDNNSGKLADAAQDQRIIGGIALAFILNYAGFFPSDLSNAMFIGLFALAFALASFSR